MRIQRAVQMAGLVLAALVLMTCGQSFAAPRFWAASPYQIRVILVPNSSQLSGERLLEDFERTFSERLSRGVRPLWQPHIEIAPAVQSQAIASQLQTADPLVPDALPPPETETDFITYDKTILVVIQDSPSGLQITAREHDGTLDRWGTPEETHATSWASLIDMAIDATTKAFSPIAAFELDPDNPSQVRLAFRGEELGKNRKNALGFARAGDVLLPYLRRIGRDGTPLPGGVQRAPWTYLVVPNRNPPPLERGGVKDTGTQVAPSPSPSPKGGRGNNLSEPIEVAEEANTTAQIYSHARSPFGSRRRGRIEQLALVVHTVPDRPTILRLHDRKETNQPLAGYQIFVSPIEAAGPESRKNLIRLGRSNELGEMAIWPNATGEQMPVLMAHIKCGSSVVASLPIAAGVDFELAVPLLDERQRLAAETKVAALREELVDLVARRRIFAARIRTRLENEDLAAAEKLLRQVESLPGISQFNQRLAHTEQLYRAKNPIVQRRLDRLFTETRSVLGSALDARELRRLANEVLEAKRSKGA